MTEEEVRYALRVPRKGGAEGCATRYTLFGQNSTVHIELFGKQLGVAAARVAEVQFGSVWFGV